MAGTTANEFSKGHAQMCLEQLGFHVERIPEAGSSRSADLRATHGCEEYIVEAKERSPQEAWLALREAAMHGPSEPLYRDVEPWSGIRRRISHAYTQLDATHGSDGAFRLLWVVAPHGDHDFVLECVEKSLLGTVTLGVFSGMCEEIGTRDCFNYEFARFRQTPRMVCAVLSSSRGGRLVVNPFARDRDAFRRSHLYGEFERARAVVDPERLVEAGDALLIDEDFVHDQSSNSGQAQWEYLKERHGLLTSRFQESAFNSMLVLPRSAFGGEDI
ncbi:MAG: hypothetical protein KBB95_18975 [Deltaproteobacteria bacterium]|jgi:hypothetical protein|nr:hypothetical protein [Deltaproteobacteria bacterium]